jgi:hypothetical protein
MYVLLLRHMNEPCSSFLSFFTHVPGMYITRGFVSCLLCHCHDSTCNCRASRDAGCWSALLYRCDKGKVMGKRMREKERIDGCTRKRKRKTEYEERTVWGAIAHTNIEEAEGSGKGRCFVLRPIFIIALYVQALHASASIELLRRTSGVVGGCSLTGSLSTASRDRPEPCCLERAQSAESKHFRVPPCTGGKVQKMWVKT